MSYVIRSLTFQEDGAVAIEYMDERTDLLENGLQLNHVCFIPSGSDYDDELERLMDVSLEVLRDALDDFTRVAPIDLTKQPASPDDDDNDDD